MILAPSRMRLAQIGIFCFFSILATFLLFNQIKTPTIDAFQKGKLSPELFELPSGINEFDLLQLEGTYYFAYDDKTTTQLRHAKSIQELATASSYQPVQNGRYPSLFYQGGVWHLWLWLDDESATVHFKATNFTGPYVASDTLPAGLADIHVRKSKSGKYLAAYKDTWEGSQMASGLLTAETLDGPWTNLGYIFTNGRDAWHAGEEADPAFFDTNGKSYVTFAGWDGINPAENQRIGIVEVNPDTGKAKGKATILLEATEPWQKKNGQKKLFNPVFLCDKSIQRIFYAQNVSVKGIPAGWGYIESENKCED